MTKPCRDIAHHDHVGLHADKCDEDTDFFVRTHSLTESGGENCASLRAWDDDEFGVLKLTCHHTTGVGHSPVAPHL